MRKELLNSSLKLYEYLSVYGVDRHNTKEDIILLWLIRDILEQDCYFSLLDECSHKNLMILFRKIQHTNPQLKYCRFNLDDYKNLGNKQNIDTYRIIRR